MPLGIHQRLSYTLGLGKGWAHTLKYYDTHSSSELSGKEDEQRLQADLKYTF